MKTTKEMASEIVREWLESMAHWAEKHGITIEYMVKDE
jgi:hypothetical protein